MSYSSLSMGFQMINFPLKLIEKNALIFRPTQYLIKKPLISVISSLTLLFQYTEAGGGVAELKALTGDAPYMGWGNQEQAPEYFGDALYRQYYQNPSYGYAPPSPYSNYNMRNAYYGGAYNRYMGGGGGGQYPPFFGRPFFYFLY